VLRLRQHDDDLIPRHVLRAVVKGAHVYVVPRPSLPGDDDAGGREIVVGATSIERGFRTDVTAGGVYELLRDATTLVPALAEARLADASAGLRPGSPDNAPLIGWTGTDGLFLATGHYRNGVLLAPLTAAVAVSELTGTPGPVTAMACDPTRFVDDRPSRVTTTVEAST
jgi:glycine oxidase